MISDDANLIVDEYQSWILMKVLKRIFLCAGYTTGSKTLKKGLNQVQAAEVLEIKKNKVISEEYWTYATHKTSKKNFNELKLQLNNIYKDVTKRMIKILKQRTAIIPLSGGYDSRLILSLLVMHNYKKIICYTYGNKDSPEIVVAKKVCDKLKIKLITIDYSNQFFDDFYRKKSFF